MPEEAIAPRKVDTEAALKKVTYCPEPAWVDLHEYPTDLERKDGEPLTRLLIDEQHDLGSQCTYFREVRRLENLDAVETLSQWQLSFNPDSQEIQLHHLTVIRDGVATEYAKEGAAHVLQREESLEYLILRGNVTLLILLEDIRPGDILDCSFTRHFRPHLLSDHYSKLTQPPSDLQTGLFHYSVRCPEGSEPKWKTHPADWKPEHRQQDGFSHLTWELTGLKRIKPEVSTPIDQLPDRWIQVSDLSDWADISIATAEAWPKAEDSTELKVEAARLAATSDDTVEQIEAAVRFVQDDFRYLSVNLEVGGQIPAAPDTVIRRRYGDCKDLSLLLSCLLNEIGVPAKPVLVDFSIGIHLPDFLPSLALFDHVVVEFEHEGRKSWVDATLLLQGGGIQGRRNHQFHYGLPISPDGGTLIEQPEPDKPISRLEIHDTLLLDTAGNPMVLRVQTMASGQYADTLRRQFTNLGSDGFLESVKEQQSSRYKIEEAIEPLQFEDDRNANLWRMVEMYRIEALHPSRSHKIDVTLPPSLAITAIPLPDSETRTQAYAIEKHLDIRHKTEIRSKSNTRQPPIKRIYDHPGVAFKLKASFLTNVWTHETIVQTTVDRIPAEEVGAFREMMMRMAQRYTFSMSVPKGIVRGHREIDFFKLPKSESPKKLVQYTERRSSNGPSAPQGQKIAAHPDAAARRVKRKKIKNVAPVAAKVEKAATEPEEPENKEAEAPSGKPEDPPTELLATSTKARVFFTVIFITALALAVYIFTR